MKERDFKILSILDAKALNGIGTATLVAHHLGYKPAANGRLAVTKMLRSLEERKLVHRIAPRDQWSSAYWSVSQLGRRSLADFSATEQTDPPTPDHSPGVGV